MEHPIIKTNIVPVSIPVRTMDREQEKEESDRVLAGQAIQFMEEEFGQEVGVVFWQQLLRFAATKAWCWPSRELKEMTESERRRFSKTEIPWGKHMGRRVEEILRKDRLELEKMAYSPLPFQLKLMRFLDSLD